MSLLSLNQATFDYGREPILTAATLAIHPGHRYALVGPNGAGKTTLLALLVGELSLQEGQRQMGSGVRVRYLRQESVLGVEGEGERPLRAVVREAAFGDELSLQADLAALSGRLAVADPALQEHQRQRVLERALWKPDVLRNAITPPWNITLPSKRSGKGGFAKVRI